MASYLMRVLLSTGINLVFVLPFFAVAFIGSRPGKDTLKPVLLFAGFILLNKEAALVGGF